MKQNQRTLITFIIILALRASAQTWQTVDDLQYIAGQPGENFGLTVAPSGTVLACGYGSDGLTAYHGLVLASMDGGNTWPLPLDDFVYPGSTTRYDGGILSDPTGNLYVAGRFYFSSGPFYRLIRRSGDGGATWQTVDTFAINSLYNSPLAAGGIATDPAGNVYATEPVSGTWMIRKGVGGTNFFTVDNFSGNANAVFVHPSFGVFAVGSTSGWLVRRSTDGGASWATVDNFQMKSGYSAAAYSVGADPRGNLYAVGRTFEPYKGNSVGHWIVRKSANLGSSWATVDDYQLFNTGNQVALGFAADSNGNLFVAGWASSNSGNGPYHWIVRESVGGMGPWTTVDDFQSVSGAMAHAITADNRGKIFVGGQGSSANGAVHWIVRRN